MLQKIIGLVFAVIILLIALGTFLRQQNEEKANAMIDEANATAIQGGEHMQTAATKYDELCSETNLAAYPGNREQLKELAKEVADHAQKSAEHYRQAADKFGEASQQDIKEKVVLEYWKLKSQTNDKFSKVVLILGEGANSFLDEGVADADALKEKIESCTKRFMEGLDEGKKISKSADKLHDENKDMFTSD